MRITRKLLEKRIAWYEKEYGFDRNDGWNQIKKDLNPIPDDGLVRQTPRAVAYGAYSELKTLLNM